MNPEPDNSPGAPSPAATTSRPDNPGVLAHPPSLYLGAFLLGMLLQWRRPLVFAPLLPESLPAPAVARIVGLLLLTAGLSLAVWGRRTMIRAGTNVNPKQPATALVVTGPFRFIRNPLYLALTLAYAGLALALNAPGPLLVLVGLLPIVHFGVVRREERYLEAKFGEPYLRYKAVTRRWI